MAEQVVGNNIPLLERQTYHESNDHDHDPQVPKQHFDEFGMPLRRKKRRTTILKSVKSRKQAVANSLIHVPSVALTLGVLSLTFRNVFWAVPSDRTNTYINLLQFAAQAHGVLIIASLSAMLLHIVHLGLASERGIPLGFVSSSFQLNSVMFLFKREFRSLRWVYVVPFLGAFVLALLSGPSSAITIIPRLQFWPIPSNWLGKGTMDFRVYIAAGAKDLYPETLTVDHLPPKCLEANASIDDSCPSYGMRYWISSVPLVTGGASPPINQTIQGSWLRYMNGGDMPVYQGIQSMYMAATLTNFLGAVLVAYEAGLRSVGQGVFGTDGVTTLQDEFSSKQLAARYDLSFRSAGKTLPTRKPLVIVECAGHQKDVKTLPLLHDRMMWPPWDAEPIMSEDWKVKKSDFLHLIGDINSTVVNSSFIPTKQFGVNRPSSGVIFSMPEVIAPSTYCSSPSCGSNSIKNNNFSLYTCTIDARWMTSRVFSDASYGKRDIFDFNPSPLDDATAILDNAAPSAPFPSMYLSDEYTKALEVPWIDSFLNPTPSNRSLIDIIGQRCLDANSIYNATNRGRVFEDGTPRRITLGPMSMLQCLQIGLSITLAEAISRYQDPLATYFVADVHGLETEDWGSDFSYVSNLYGAYLPQYFDPKDTSGQRFSKADLQDPNRFTEVYITGARWGYGYGFHDSILVYVGTIILLLHVALTLAFIIWIIWTGDFHDAGWDTIGGLVSMAMRSGTVDEREVEDNKTRWRERLAVRGLGEERVLDSKKGGKVKRVDEVLVLRRVGVGRSDVESLDEEGDRDGVLRRSGESAVA